MHITGEVIDRAADLARHHKLRGADAVHLATALDLWRVLTDINEPLVVVTSDDELLGAARAVGLQVENPVSGSTASSRLEGL